MDFNKHIKIIKNWAHTSKIHQKPSGLKNNGFSAKNDLKKTKTLILRKSSFSYTAHTQKPTKTMTLDTSLEKESKKSLIWDYEHQNEQKPSGCKNILNYW